MASTAPTVAASTGAGAGLHDFDFLAGTWRVHHRRLKDRLAGSDEWQEFAGTSVGQLILDGAGNLDDNVLELPDGTYRAATLRSYDAASGQWSIWWLDGRHPRGPLDPPMVGSFSDGVGLFLADDTFQGRPIRVRFIWSEITDASARWEQAFSTDGGATWEVNWIMTFTRVE
jgi:hypothetical protein